MACASKYAESGSSTWRPSRKLASSDTVICSSDSSDRTRNHVTPPKTMRIAPATMTSAASVRTRDGVRSLSRGAAAAGGATCGSGAAMGTPSLEPPALDGQAHDYGREESDTSPGPPPDGAQGGSRTPARLPRADRV